MPSKLPRVHLLLKETPSTLVEYRAWLLKVIEAWHEYMQRESYSVPAHWRVKLLHCVERSGLHGDRVGLHSLLGGRPSLVAYEPEAILRYLRLCQQTAEAAMNRASVATAKSAPHNATAESETSGHPEKKPREEASRAVQAPGTRRVQPMPENPSLASGNMTGNALAKAPRDKVFISYSHKDTKFLDQLLVHLKPLERAGLVTKWSDKQIAPGSQWFAEIQAALASTSVAVMMVTPHFLASDFIHEHELGPLLKEAEQGGVRILWIPVRACSYTESPLKNYQAVSTPDRPLAEMKANRDGAWVKVCEAIKKALNP